MNNNKSTVVEQYHSNWNDKQVRPTMIEVCISVQWYTIDEQPNWHPSLNARKSRVVNKGKYNGKPHNVYETVGSAERLEKLFSNHIWEKYCGQSMPNIGTNLGSTCRPDNIYQQPLELIESLKRFSENSRTKKFVCGTGKFWVEANNKHRDEKRKVQIDPNPTQEEISKMIMLFENEQETIDFIEEVMSKVKGFTSEQIKLNEVQHDNFFKR